MNNKKSFKLSIIIPCFNEKKTLVHLVDKVISSLKNYGYDFFELIIVDDCSTDGTKELIKENFVSKKNFQTFFHDKNMGKGAAIKTAKNFLSGDIIIIQDADLEYDPYDYNKLLEPIFSNKAKVVYGSRVLDQNRYETSGFTSKIRIFGNHSLTIISNFLNNQNLTDAHTCYKMFRSEIFSKIKLEEDDFSFCPEITTKVGLKKIKIKEVSIRYNGRSYEEGKKIKFIDGIKAVYVLFKYRFFQ